MSAWIVFDELVLQLATSLSQHVKVGGVDSVVLRSVADSQLISSVKALLT